MFEEAIRDLLEARPVDNKWLTRRVVAATRDKRDLGAARAALARENRRATWRRSDISGTQRNHATHRGAKEISMRDQRGENDLPAVFAPPEQDGLPLELQCLFLVSDVPATKGHGCFAALSASHGVATRLLAAAHEMSGRPPCVMRKRFELSYRFDAIHCLIRG
jgi:hypothetical protein